MERILLERRGIKKDYKFSTSGKREVWHNHYSLEEEVTLLKSKLENMTKSVRMLNNGIGVLAGS